MREEVKEIREGVIKRKEIVIFDYGCCTFSMKYYFFKNFGRGIRCRIMSALHPSQQVLVV